MLKVQKRNIDPKLYSLIQSPRWPFAVNPDELCPPTSELEKSRRAEGVIEVMIEKSVKGCRVLDIGCGEGHTTMEFANQEAAFAIGYDIVQEGVLKWEEASWNKLLTTDWNKVVENAPYDIIMVHDVIDHMASEPVAIDVMKKAFDVAHRRARVFARCHPWMTRHGGHLYQECNKAWIHLLLKKEELETLIPGYNPPHILKFKNPTEAYDRIFVAAGWTIRYQTKANGHVEEIFYHEPMVVERLKEAFDGTARYMMIINPFLDYVLVKD